MLTTVERLIFIQQVPIFAELRDDFIVKLASVMDELSFPAKHTIFRQNEEGGSLYILMSGSVSIYNGDKVIAQISDKSENNYFGEMAVFDAMERSASVITNEPCDCLELTQEQLYEAIEETPEIALNIIRVLSKRIRKLNQLIPSHQTFQELSSYT
ncbi:Crp/Fnr family transcriptional regulator [Calothrix sp. NIES-3974]|uniref:Crp/Fnr family transcriptional regulator n=1 Tax=Calothrix sp. NIES-3974 TaxID=2005462 RepID=UPI000B60BE2F|nr:cyclic nucleotide-binding domain-containing protein [Calothrix sp. NIES-3974]BAZ06126.1 putative Crp/Fnr family transcriptional regulator [Calothrix sp. NIES-3974]